ncbi:MAG TPA: hypothetical protein DD706_06100 [Nitrospiraceae bacterium]|nr:hypothetical protein [Nitrospiraceae bacterium]
MKEKSYKLTPTVKVKVRVVFVGGVHGVGKSTCCQQASERNGLQWYTASSLINAERQSTINERSKEVLDPKGNQELLINGLDKLKTSGHERVILDGHFTLLRPGGEIIAVGIDVFAQLRLEIIVVFRDDPASICKRLGERDEQVWPISIVDGHQEAEINRAYVVASFLKIPIFTLPAFDVDGLVREVGVLRSFPTFEN